MFAFSTVLRLFAKIDFEKKHMPSGFEPDLNCGKKTYNDSAKADLFFKNKSAFIYQ